MNKIILSFVAIIVSGTALASATSGAARPTTNFGKASTQSSNNTVERVAAAPANTSNTATAGRLG